VEKDVVEVDVAHPENLRGVEVVDDSREGEEVDDLTEEDEIGIVGIARTVMMKRFRGLFLGIMMMAVREQVCASSATNIVKGAEGLREEVVRDVIEVTLVIEVDNHLRMVEVVDDSREGEEVDDLTEEDEDEIGIVGIARTVIMKRFRGLYLGIMMMAVREQVCASSATNIVKGAEGIREDMRRGGSNRCASNY